MMSVLSGFPSLKSYASSAVTATAGSLLSKLVDYLFDSTLYAVYTAGTTDEEIKPTGIYEMDVSAESRVPTYMLENGTFAAYNKIKLPIYYQFQMIWSGSVSNRESALTNLETLRTSTTLLDILTPEKTYSNVTLVGWRQSRSAISGTNTLVIDALFQEIPQGNVTYSTSSNSNYSSSSGTTTTQTTTTTSTSQGGSVNS